MAWRPIERPLAGRAVSDTASPRSSAPIRCWAFVANWPTLPQGYNTGEGGGVDVDAQGNVWFANRGEWPIIEFDASVGGLGGCPYAPGATGNVATEEVVHMLHDMGIETGIDLGKLIDAARLAQEIVGRELPSGVLRAGPRT